MLLKRLFLRELTVSFSTSKFFKDLMCMHLSVSQKYIVVMKLDVQKLY